MTPWLLDRLLRVERAVRRRRRATAAVVAGAVGAIAVADSRLWPGVSLAFGYTLPIALGAYAFGTRVGVALSVLCVVLRRVCAGRAYGPWWLYAGSALMLAEYLMLAIGAGLLGRAVRRIERHTRVLKRLSEIAPSLTTELDTEELVRQSVAAGVRLCGADGGFALVATGAEWTADAIFVAGHWAPQQVAWPLEAAPWGSVSQTESTPVCTVVTGDPRLRRLGAEVALAVVLPSAPAASRALLVFRRARRAFEAPTREAFQLLALQVAAALEAARRCTAALRAKHDQEGLLAHVAQDLAASLRSMLASVDVLGRQAVGEAGRAGLERLARQTRLLVGTATNLLEFSRLQAATPPVATERIHLPSLYAEVRELAAPLIGEKDVRIDVHVAPAAEWVESDPEKLRQILANLATNAVKYTRVGRVELRAERVGGQLVVLSVRDTGIGIPATEHTRIFEPFYRVEGAIGTRSAGVGLGLAVAQDLATLLGTRIDVASREQEGTTFSLALDDRAGKRAPQARRRAVS